MATPTKKGAWDVQGTFDKSITNQWNYSGVTGQIWQWGRNYNGNLGMNEQSVSYSSPVQLPGSWSQFVSGSLGTGGIKTDGTLWVWGDNQGGWFGQNTEGEYRSSPVQTGTDTNWEKLWGIGGQRLAAKKTDGTWWIWGANDAGQLGLNGANTDRSSPIQLTWASGDEIVSLTGNDNAVIATKSDGTSWGWGQNVSYNIGNNSTTSRSSPVQIGTASNWAMASLGSFGGIALTTTGEAWSWGQNTMGQLGQNSISQITSRQKLMDSDGGDAYQNWSYIHAGHYASAGVKTDGTLWMWGRNSYGNLGLNSSSNGGAQAYSSPVQVGTDTTWKYVYSQTDSTIAQKTDGTLWTWGRNNWGQLGQNEDDADSGGRRSSPVQILGNFTGDIASPNPWVREPSASSFSIAAIL